MADDIIGSLGIQIEADASDFPGQFDAAVAQAEAAGQSIAQGFNSGAAGVDSLTDSANGLTTALSGLKALGIAGAIEEIGSASLEAYGNLQKATIALTSLTGSAAQAQDEISSLRTMAQDDALSFPSLVSANQRFTALGVAANQIPGALTAAANASAAMNISFDTAANAIERITSSGTLSSRVLVQLGINLQDVAQSMGVSSADVVKDFKAITDEGERLSILTDAMSKLQGTAQAVADSLSGSFQRVQNTLETTFQQIGASIAPAASDLANLAQVVIPQLGSAIEGLAAPAVSIVEFGKALVDAKDSISTLVDAATGLPGTFNAISKAAQDSNTSLVGSLVPGLDLVTQGFKTLTNQIEAYTNQGSNIVTMGNLITENLDRQTTALKVGGQAFQDAMKGATAFIGSENELSTSTTKLVTDAQAAQKAFADMTTAFQNGTKDAAGNVVSANDLSNAYDNLQKKVAALNALNPVYADSLAGLTTAFNKQEQEIDALQGTIAQLLAVTDRTQAQDDILAEATNKLTGLLKAQADAHGLVTAAVQGQGKAYDGLTTSADAFMAKEIAVGVSVQQAKAVLDQLTSSTDTSAEHTRAVNDALKQYTDAIVKSGGAMTDQIAIEVNGVSVLTTVGDAINKAKDAQNGFNTTTVNGVQVIRDSGTAHAIAATQVNQYAQAVRNANDNTSQAINFNSSLAAAIDHTRDATSDEISVNNAWNDSISTSVDNASKFANSINGVTAALHNMATAEDEVGTAAFDAGKGLEGMNGQTANALQYVAGVLALSKSPATAGMVSESAIEASEQALHKMGYEGDAQAGFVFSQQLYDAMNGVTEASTKTSAALTTTATASTSVASSTTAASSSLSSLSSTIRDLNASATQTSSTTDGLTTSFTTANQAVDFAGMTGTQLGAAIGKLGTELLSAGVVVDGADLSAVDYATKLQSTVDGMNASSAAVQQMSQASQSAAVGIATAAAVVEAAGAMVSGVTNTAPSQQMQDALTNMTSLATPGTTDLGSKIPNILATFNGQVITGSPGMSLSSALAAQDLGIGSGSSSTGPMPLYTGAPQPTAQPISVTMNYPVFSSQGQSQQTMKDIVSQIRTVTGIKQ